MATEGIVALLFEKLFIGQFSVSGSSYTFMYLAGQQEAQPCPTGQDSPHCGQFHPTGLTLADHFAVSEQLRPLLHEDLMRLGLALGLYYPHLHNMSRPLLNEMVASWLNLEDNVLSATGVPSWASLIKALQVIDQPGIAGKVRSLHSMLGVMACRYTHTLTGHVWY